MDYIILRSVSFHCQPAVQRISQSVSQSAGEVASTLQEAKGEEVCEGGRVTRPLFTGAGGGGR